MARALTDILTELNSVYNPQRQSAQGIYDKGIEATNPMESADLAGLEQAKKDSFDQITTGANRRGMFFSGVPLKEQAQYVGQNFLPGVANLKNRYAGIRGNLYQTLAQTLGNIDVEKNKYGREIYNAEVAQDLERERIAAAERAAASRGSGGSGSGGFSPSFGGGFTAVQGAQDSGLSLRQQWQNEASGGDWNAQVALNYAGDDGRYDGKVNSKAEYDILKSMGITGNYYPPSTIPTPAGTVRSSSGGGVGLVDSYGNPVNTSKYTIGGK